ncbi:hypothetical protein ACFWAN_46370, partial [Streptomyces mirabilis]|uniref:hypothetical protein n=1 Tax=Streptomyces mirabilis TaxID=68239 RepID=UPI003666104D
RAQSGPRARPRRCRARASRARRPPSARPGAGAGPAGLAGPPPSQATTQVTAVPDLPVRRSAP